MGKGRDKRKKSAKKDAESLERKRERQLKKSKKIEHRKIQRIMDSDDVDNCMMSHESFNLANDITSKISCLEFEETATGSSTTPSARAASTLTAHPYLESSDMLLFGGEFFDGRKTITYDSLYRFNTVSNTWREIIPQNVHSKTNAESGHGKMYYTMSAPPARSGHAAVGLSQLGCIIIFGGEYVSPNQKIFQHFSDTWQLRVDKRGALKSSQHEMEGKSISCYSWIRLDDKKSMRIRPNARSGHRMAAWNNKVILFGGFFDIDSGSSVRYFNDLWVLENLEAENQPQWQLLDDGGNSGSQAFAHPAPRSGHCLTVQQSRDTVWLFGGYSVHYVKPIKGASDKSENNGIPILHNDLWKYDLNARVWVVVKTELGIPPSPRCGISMATHPTKAKSYLFGGVKDETGPSLHSSSHFYNDLFIFDHQTQKFFPQTIKRSKNTSNLDEFKLQSWYRVASTNAKPFGVVPCERFNAMMCVLGNNKLYVFGGQREFQKREITFSDLYCVDLTTRSHFTLLIDMDLSQVVWHGKDMDDDSEWATTLADDTVSSMSTQEPPQSQNAQGDSQRGKLCKKEFTMENGSKSSTLTSTALQNHDAVLKETERRKRVTFQL